MTALELFRLLAVEFAGIPDETVQQYIDLAASFLDESAYPPDKWEMAQALMAAHIMAIRDRSAASSTSGQITSEREGDLSRSYGLLSKDQTWLGSTTYGEMLEMIMNQVYGPAIMTRMG